MKNIGLSKNSPINLKLSRQNYEALVYRHGQLVRWMMADKCACTLRSGRPDVNCEYCGGDGIRYSFQKTKTITGEKAEYLGNGIIQLACPVGSCVTVHRITNGKVTYQIEEILDGKFVKIVGTQPDRWDYIEATYDMTDEVLSTDAPAKYLGGHLFSVDLPTSNTDHGPVVSDITEVLELKNATTGEIYTIDDARRNFIYINDVPFVQNGDIITASVRYIAPRIFLILGQSANKVEQQFLDMVGGDASMTFSDEYTVSEGDVVTALVATTFQKAIITRSSLEYDRIPEWYISEIVKLETRDQTYTEGIDFYLFDRNKIMWVGQGPVEGSDYSIMFSYHPTYKVLRDFPNIRSSENQKLPRKVAIKLMTMGGASGEGV